MTYDIGDIVCQADQPWRVFVVEYLAHGSYGVRNVSTGHIGEVFLIGGGKLEPAGERYLAPAIYAHAMKLKLTKG